MGQKSVLPRLNPQSMVLNQFQLLLLNCNTKAGETFLLTNRYLVVRTYLCNSYDIFG